MPSLEEEALKVSVVWYHCRRSSDVGPMSEWLIYDCIGVRVEPTQLTQQVDPEQVGPLSTCARHSRLG